MARVKILEHFENRPQPLDFVWPGFLAGTVGALVAPGASGKSFWALEAAMAVACDTTGGDLIDLRPESHGAVVYFSAEDPEPILAWRLHEIGKRLSAEARQSINQLMLIEDVVGKRIDLMNERHLNYLIQYCMGARLIVLDTISRMHNLDENSNADMARLVSTLEYMAKETGSSILYLHHVSKGSTRDRDNAEDQHAARGASALTDNSRWAGYLRTMTKQEAKELTDGYFNRRPIGEDRRRFYVKFGVSKQNYGEPQEDRWYQRAPGGVLVPVEITKAKDENNGGKRRDREEA
ncbi:MAG: helicase RepA family protein [Halothiobacillaceae bacterium]